MDIVDAIIDLECPCSNVILKLPQRLLPPSTLLSVPPIPILLSLALSWLVDGVIVTRGGGGGWNIVSIVLFSFSRFVCKRSGSGLVGAFPYLNCMFPSVGLLVVSSFLSWPPEPVEPTRVTELKFDGDDGPLGAAESFFFFF